MTGTFFQRAGCWGRDWWWGRLLRGMVGVVGLLMVGGLGEAAGQGREVVVHSKSQFWIQGEATTHHFTCRVNQVEGEATLPPARQSLSSSENMPPPAELQPAVIVRAPVRAFDCGNSRMTRDLKETLKMDEHPAIRFELVHASVGDAPVDTSNTWRAINVLGTLTIAGTKRLVRLEATGHALDENRFRVRGCTPIQMTYFNIEPPTKAFGIIKVKNRVEVQFDLLAYVPAAASATPFQAVSVDQSPSC